MNGQGLAKDEVALALMREREREGWTDKSTRERRVVTD